jgi:hypothetical protein
MKSNIQKIMVCSTLLIALAIHGLGMLIAMIKQSKLDNDLSSKITLLENNDDSCLYATADQTLCQLKESEADIETLRLIFSAVTVGVIIVPVVAYSFLKGCQKLSNTFFNHGEHRLTATEKTPLNELDFRVEVPQSGDPQFRV